MGPALNAAEGSRPTSVTSSCVKGQQVLCCGVEQAQPRGASWRGLHLGRHLTAQEAEEKVQSQQDPEEVADMAPKDQGAQGGQRARRARQQGEHHPAGTGEPRRSCRERTVSWGGEVARRSRSSRPRSPEPLQPPPSLLLEPRQEPRAPRPPSPKKSGPWVPRAGDFVAKSGFPHSAVLSQEPRAGAGAGGGKSQPLPAAWAGSRAHWHPGPGQATRTPPCPAPRPGTRSHNTLPHVSAQEGPTWARGHWGLGGQGG